MKALSLLDVRETGTSSSSSTFSSGAGEGVGGATLFLDFRADFLMVPSASVPVSVSDGRACLLLALGVLFVGLRNTDRSDSLSSDLTLVVVFLDLTRGVGGGGISSSSPTVLSCESASVIPLLVRLARALAARILRD